MQRLARAHRRSAATLTVAAFLTGRLLHAQDPRPLTRPDSIPTELAMALVAAGGLGAEPEILVGAIPPWAATRLYLPSGARVLGSAFIGTTVVAIASMPLTDSVLPALRRGLLEHGWKEPPPRPSYSSGFLPAPLATRQIVVPQTMLCGDQQLLTFSATRERGMATVVTYRLTNALPFSICNPPPAPSLQRPLFPTLYNPADAEDARGTMACRSDVADWTGTSTVLRTPVSPDSLLAHYGRQLADSGWSISGGGMSVVGRTWMRADSTGAPLELTLSVRTPARAADCRDVSLQVRTLPRRP